MRSRPIFTLLFLLPSLLGFSQLSNLYPQTGPEPDLDPVAIADFNEAQERMMELFEKEEKGQLSDREKHLYGLIDEVRSSYFEVGPGQGCSWYCGGGPKKINASSTLKANGKITYLPENAHDFDIRTAWVEGSSGQGIGEYLEYRFPPLGPPVTEITVYNGYGKSLKAWNDNARVQQLKMYVNDQPFAMLNLEDTRGPQSFPFEELQSKKENVDLSLRFEIASVYPGDKWEDTAISEIYFDGTGVHCFPAGTQIALPGNGQKAIEKIEPGDIILSYNPKSQKLESTVVEGTALQRHHNLVQVITDSGATITATNDHPFWTMSKGWAAVAPDNAARYLGKIPATLEPGDEIYQLDEAGNLISSFVVDIETLQYCEVTFTITRMSRNHIFFADGFAVGVESQVRKEGL